MDLLKRIHWNIIDQYLREATVDGRQLTKDELRLLQSPIRLETPKLILNLRPSKYVEAIPVEFEVGPEVTPLVILGAIHTYYSPRRDGMNDVLFVQGFLQQPDGSLTPEMEPEFRVMLPHVEMTVPKQLPIAPATPPIALVPPPTPLVPPATPEQRFGLTMHPYSEKSLVVRGNPDHDDDIANAMDQLGGKYNAYLKGGAGWIFPKFKKEQVENYFTTGRHYPLPRPAPKQAPKPNETRL